MHAKPQPAAAAEPAAPARPAATAPAGATAPAAAEVGPLELGHPKGTLAIVTLYGFLLALGCLALYWLVFVPCGTPHP
jgi:hypothetical protein